MTNKTTNKTIPHFYKAYTRLGTRNNPSGQDHSSKGVETAPDKVLSLFFLDVFKCSNENLLSWYKGSPRWPGSEVDEFHFSDPEKVPDGEYYETIAKESRQFGTLINSTLKAGEIPCVVGGDHSFTYATIGALAQRVDPKRVLVVQFDSHFDFCQPEEIASGRFKVSSPSGNFHGMGSRACFDKFGIDCIDAYIPNKVSPKNWVYVGDFKGEEGYDFVESQFAASKGIEVITKENLEADLGRSQKLLEERLAYVDFVHVTVDIDVYHRNVAPATGISGNWGLRERQVLPLLYTIARSGKLAGVDLAEINPQVPNVSAEDVAQTVAAGQEILYALLGR